MPNNANVREEDDATPEPCTLLEASATRDVGKKLKFKGLIHAIEQEKYLVPATVRVFCSRDQPMCVDCPIFTLQEEPIVDIPKDSRELLGIIGSEDKKHRELLRDAIGIPKCKVCQFEPKMYYSANEILVMPPIDNYLNTEDQVTLSCVTMDTEFSLNETYEIVGRRYAHPKDQRSLVLVTERAMVGDTLSEYQTDASVLKKFRPLDWSLDRLEAKLKDIYDDLALNVTRIFARQDLHLLIDLTYHSCLYFKPLHSDQPQKGWVESLIVGDSAQGKSETLQNMMRHYGLGKRVESKGATSAGLLGGVTSINGKHYVTWGEIPAQDRRLCALEEIKGMPPEVMARITDMRSSGWAEVPKIVRGRTRARTRLIMISNGKKNRAMDQYAYGVSAIKELIGADEDIRRFDIFTVLAKDEVSTDIIHKASRLDGTSEKRYDAHSCRSLVLWAWTRNADQIEFEDWEELLNLSEDLCKEFTDAIPIVDRASQRMKMARLCIALAARTFSTIEGTGYQKLIVRRCHVQYVYQLLIRLYTTKAFGYDRYTKDHRHSEADLDIPVVNSAILSSQYPKTFVKMLLRENVIDVEDIMDCLDFNREQAKSSISKLVRANALVRERGGRASTVYTKTSKFIDYLRQFADDDPKFSAESVPSYVKPDM